MEGLVVRPPGVTEPTLELLRRIAEAARAAAKGKQWARNFALCKRHDDMMLKALRGEPLE